MIRLREIRKAKNMKQSELSEKIGVSVQTISSWENGKTPIDAPSILAICETLECSPNALLGWVEYAVIPFDSSDEGELLKKWRNMDEQAKAMTMSAVDAAQPKNMQDDSVSEAGIA